MDYETAEIQEIKKRKRRVLYACAPLTFSLSLKKKKKNTALSPSILHLNLFGVTNDDGIIFFSIYSIKIFSILYRFFIRIYTYLHIPIRLFRLCFNYSLYLTLAWTMNPYLVCTIYTSIVTRINWYYIICIFLFTVIFCFVIVFFFFSFCC